MICTSFCLQFTLVVFEHVVEMPSIINAYPGKSATLDYLASASVDLILVCLADICYHVNSLLAYSHCFSLFSVSLF